MTERELLEMADKELREVIAVAPSQSKHYCLTMCSMQMANLLMRAAGKAGWRYEEAVGCSELLLVGDIAGDSMKILRAKALGVKTVVIGDFVATAFALAAAEIGRSMKR
jgi:hypothetical protein